MVTLKVYPSFERKYVEKFKIFVNLIKQWDLNVRYTALVIKFYTHKYH
jgi:hypothetical protein